MPKISALPPITTTDNLDELPVVDDSTSTTKKLTLSDLKAIFSPVGTVIDYAGLTEPTGWLFCYGQAISRTTYADLFAVLSTTYGVGDGSTTFNLPDLRGRVVAGQDDMGGTSANRLTGLSGGVDGDVLGGTGGLETHTLTTAQLASHSHVKASQFGTDGGAFADYGAWSKVGGSAGGGSGSTDASGSGSAHNNVQPTIILNKIIKY